MNEKMERLDRYLASRKERLAAGEVLTVKLEDGMLTAYKESDPESGEEKIVTLVEEFDDHLDLSIHDLLQGQL